MTAKRSSLPKRLILTPAMIMAMASTRGTPMEAVAQNR